MGDLPAVSWYVAEDFREHYPPPGLPEGIAGAVALVQVFQDNFGAYLRSRRCRQKATGGWCAAEAPARTPAPAWASRPPARPSASGRRTSFRSWTANSRRAGPTATCSACCSSLGPRPGPARRRAGRRCDTVSGPAVAICRGSQGGAGSCGAGQDEDASLLTPGRCACCSDRNGFNVDVRSVVAQPCRSDQGQPN